MVKVNIRGKEFPLCLTVAALDKINEKCGGLSELTEFLSGSGDLGKSFRNTAWLMALLIEEGEKNRRVCSQFDGNPVDSTDLPDYEQLCAMCTIHTMMGYRSVALDAISASMHQDIEASHTKNVESAERA